MNLVRLVACLRVAVLTVIMKFPNNKPVETLAGGYTKTELIMAQLCG